MSMLSLNYSSSIRSRPVITRDAQILLPVKIVIRQCQNGLAINNHAEQFVSSRQKTCDMDYIAHIHF